MENIHPVDALALCRERIKRLKEEEDNLKEAVKQLPGEDLVGRHFAAVVTQRIARRVDNAALHADVTQKLGEEYLEQFVRQDASVVVTLKDLEGR